MKTRLFGWLLVLVPVFVPRVAAADAAQDVKDIKSGQLPVRHEWLGWDGSTPYVQTLVCSSGGTTSCTSTLVAGSKRTELLSVVEVYCGGGPTGGACAALDAATVKNFVAAEKKARAALPTLTKTAAEKDPSALFGTIAGEATKVAVRTRDVSPSADDPKLRVELVLEGKGGAREVLGVVDSAVQRVNGSKIVAAYPSPDKKKALYVVSLESGVMCWDFQGLSVIDVDGARARASLANTIGFRAYQKKDFAAAKSGFVEATQLDGTFGLGWYNRAAIESRDGDVSAAATSFTKASALDSSFSRRACKDPDFDSLRRARPELVACD